eukprot:COSAG04_NODE_63_length_30038_cov_9.461071_20_plen_190_part_00
MLYKEAATTEESEIYRPAGMVGMGWWGDAWDEVKSVAKKVQKNPVVRGLEKKAVDYGSKAIRGVAEGAVDSLADSALSAVGAPELAPMADKLIDKGASYLQKKGSDYLKQEIDQSGKGKRRIRYMSPAGGGMRLAGHGTAVGRGLRLAGQGHCGHGMRVAGQGLRLAGSGLYVPAGRHGLLEGNGHAMC